MEGGASHNGEPPPGAGQGGHHRRRRKGRTAKVCSDDSAGDPHGKHDADGDTAGGDVGRAVHETPRHGPVGRQGGRHGDDAEPKNLRLGGLHGEPVPEKRHLGGRDIGAEHVGHHGDADPDKLRLGGRHGDDAKPENLRLGGLHGEPVPEKRHLGGRDIGAEHVGHHGDADPDKLRLGGRHGDDAKPENLRLGGLHGEPVPEKRHLGGRDIGAEHVGYHGDADPKKLRLGGRNVGVEHDDVQQLRCGDQQAAGGLGSRRGSRRSGEAAAGEPHWTLVSVDQMAGERGDAVLENANASGGGCLGGHLAGHNNSNTEHTRHGLGDLDSHQSQHSFTQDGVSAKADTEAKTGAETMVITALAGTTSKTKLPRSNFLSRALLSWTMEDILNDHLYEKEVQKIPSKYDSTIEFIKVHRGLLLEETRADLLSNISNEMGLQSCELLSVQMCELPFLYYLDIKLGMGNSCHHIAQDYDLCLLSAQSSLDSNISEMSLAMVVGVGRDVSFMKSFKVMIRPENFEPEKIKYVTFIGNIKFKMTIADILSEEKDHTAVEAVLQLYKTAVKKCESCAELNKGDVQPLVSQKHPWRLTCLHKNKTDIVWAPPGTLKGSVAAMFEEFQDLKLKVLICVTNTSIMADLLVDLDELSVSPDTGEVVFINSAIGQETCNKYEKYSLEYQSQELYCCLTECEGSLRAMLTLLKLNAYYHTSCSDGGVFCKRCSDNETKLLKFTRESVARRFDAIIGFLEKSLVYLKNHATSFFLLDRDTALFEELIDDLKQIEVLLNDKNLRASFEEDGSLIPAADGALGSRANTLIECLNERRSRSMTMISGILHSLQLPEAEDRNMLDRFCIKNSRIILTTLDQVWQLYGIKMDPFHLMIVQGAGQIREDELLVPFLLQVGHTVFMGDHFHLEPVIKSKICKEAGYGVSIFEKLQQLVPRKQMLTCQYSVDPSIYQFPNSYFYKGKVINGPNVRCGREFIPLKLPRYVFLDIPTAILRSLRRGYVYLAATLQFLQQFCEDMKNCTQNFNVAVVCMSSAEASIARAHLRSKKQTNGRIHIQVTSIDSLEEESFDFIILSTLMEDGPGLKSITEKKLNVALTSSRHCFWIVGEQKVLNGSGGIWKALIRDAYKRGCIEKVDKDAVVEESKKLEINDVSKIQYTNANSTISGETPSLPGQEFTWDGRPYRTKYILPAVRDQRDQTDTCTLHATLGALESIMKFEHASLEPPEEFTWDFPLDDLKMKYKKDVSKTFLSEDKANRGTKRLENVLEVVKNHGVLATNESRTKCKTFKILGWERVNLTETKPVKKLLTHGDIMVGHFRVSKNFYSLKPGEVYDFDADQALLNPRSDQPASHAVVMIGIGRKIVHNGYHWHMAMQNSQGTGFGHSGIGRVGRDTIRGLYRINVPEIQSANSSC